MSESISDGNETPGQVLFRHEKDLYRGDYRKPGITTRLEQCEDRLSSSEDCHDSTNKRLENQDKKFWTIIILLLGVIIGIATDVAKGGRAH